jgi:hypothetical protein
MVKLETLLARAATEYAIDEANEAISFPYSPARATAAIAKRYGYPKSRLVPLVAEVYYRENGTRAPLSFDRLAKDGLPTEKGIARAVKRARDAGGRLARWEVLAYRLAVAIGREPGSVSVAAVRAFYVAAGGDTDASYTGRGTRAGAVATRADETAELAGLASSSDEEGDA